MEVLHFVPSVAYGKLINRTWGKKHPYICDFPTGIQRHTISGIAFNSGSPQVSTTIEFAILVISCRVHTFRYHMMGFYHFYARLKVCHHTWSLSESFFILFCQKVTKTAGNCKKMSGIVATWLLGAVTSSKCKLVAKCLEYENMTEGGEAPAVTTSRTCHK